MVAKTPLWFYVLREAEVNGGSCTASAPGSWRRRSTARWRGSKHSIVRDTAFRPTLGPDSNTFRMVDLLLFAFEGKKGLLAPLGD